MLFCSLGPMVVLDIALSVLTFAFCLFTFNYLLIPPALCAMRYALLFLACQAIKESNPSRIRCVMRKSNRMFGASVVSCPVVGAVVSC